MGLLSPRKLYLTPEEFDTLGEMGLQQANGSLSTTEFVNAVTGLTGVGQSVLLRHRWEVVVKNEVTQRCGRNWQTRGNLKRRMEMNDKAKVAAAHERALESLRVKT